MQCSVFLPSGVTVIVVGIGSDVDIQELDFIAGGHDKAFLAATFGELTGSDFTDTLSDEACEVGKLFTYNPTKIIERKRL